MASNSNRSECKLGTMISFGNRSPVCSFPTTGRLRARAKASTSKTDKRVDASTSEATEKNGNACASKPEDTKTGARGRLGKFVLAHNTPLPEDFDTKLLIKPETTKVPDRLFFIKDRRTLRRPKSWVAPPLPKAFYTPMTVPKDLPVSEDPRFAPFNEFFTEKQLTETQVFRVIDEFVFYEANNPGDLQKMVVYLMDMSVECSVNVVPIFKALYIVTRSPIVGPPIRTFVFEEAEHRFIIGLKDLMEGQDGERKFRNFVMMMMALTHHYRNIFKAPIFELVECLYVLADHLAPMQYFSDVPMFVLLVLRIEYYWTLPQPNETETDRKLTRGRREWHKEFMSMARRVARKKIVKDHELPPTYKKWLNLLLEARGTAVHLDRELVEAYESLPEFSKLMPHELKVMLPYDCDRSSFDIAHMAGYLTFETAPMVEILPTISEEATYAAVAENPPPIERAC